MRALRQEADLHLGNLGIHLSTRLGLAVLAAVALPHHVCAQDRSIFAALDVGDRVVTPGSGPARGTLTPDDLIATGGRRIQVWRLDASLGQRLQVDLRSGDFDPYVYVVGPGLAEGLADDDGGEGLNARVCVVVDEPGEYRIVASSLSSATGGYTLQVREREGASDGTCPEDEPEGPAMVDDIGDLPTAGRVLAVGTEVTGELSPSDPIYAGSPAQAWALEGRAGQSVTIDLLSDAFDAYLFVSGPGLGRSLSDDDGAGRCDSRIRLSLPEDGTYRVVASTLGSTGAGPYRLVTSQEPRARSEEPCVPPSSAASPARDAGRVATVGSLAWERTHEGVLTGDEALYEDRKMQGWSLEGREGERIVVEMRSSDFDSYLYLTGPGFDEPARNDDGGGNLNARLCVELPHDGTYRVLAGPYSGGEAGHIYTIRASRADAASLCETFEISAARIAEYLASLPTEGRSLTVGSEAAGRLGAEDPRHPDSGHTVQAWRFEGAARRTVYVDVVSDDFDAVLYAVGTGIEGVLYIDDAGDGCNVRMSITPSASGPIVLLPGSFYGDATGDFVIRASEDPPPLEAGGCGAGSGASARPDALATVGSGASRRMQVGTIVSGTLGPEDERLSSGEPAQAWTMMVRAGDELVVDLVSEDFDPVLYIDGAMLAETLRDDDSLGNQDAQIVLTAPTNGTLRLVVSAYSPEGSGSFELRAVRRIR
jgi:hypothetical protein